LDPVGEFAFALHSGNWLGAVQVQKTGIVEAERFAAYPSLASFVGGASDVTVNRVAFEPDPLDPDAASFGYAVYTTSSCFPDCDFGSSEPCSVSLEGLGGSMMMSSSSSTCQEVNGCEILPCDPEFDPACGGGGGGGTGTNARSVALEVRVLRPRLEGGAGPLLDGADPWRVECVQNIELSRIDYAGGPNWPQIGMDFNSDRSELFIANPDTDSLFIFNTQTNELEPISATNPNPLQIPVGLDPFDVEILQVKDVSETVVDRAYVANHGDDTMSIVDVVNRQPATPFPRNLTNDFQGLTDLQVETMAGSEATKSLFLVSPNRQRILRFELQGAGIHGDNPSPGDPLIVGPLPRRVALQE
jgi:hypothetical protein